MSFSYRKVIHRIAYSMMHDCHNAQVLVPGKQNYSLAITWALDYDPVQAVQDVLNGEVFEEALPAQNGQDGPHGLPTEGGAAMLAQRSLKIWKSRSLEDAAKVSVVRPDLLRPALLTRQMSCTCQAIDLPHEVASLLPGMCMASSAKSAGTIHATLQPHHRMMHLPMISKLRLLVIIQSNPMSRLRGVHVHARYDVAQQCHVLLQAEADLAIERDSAESGASFSTDVGEAGKQIERSSKSLSALKPVRTSLGF